MTGTLPKCPITGCSNKRLLTASHIKPKILCETDKAQQDPYNGIALTPTYDKLFDSGFISFQDDGRVIISSMLSSEDCKTIGLHSKMRIDLPAKSLKYMDYHRENVLKK